MLHSDRFEKLVTYPLYVGAASTAFQGVACAALFSWAMGATEVFAADARVNPKEPACMCYYMLPPEASLAALTMPVVLLFRWSQRLQLLGMSALFGDYLYNVKYIV